ncbi:MAG TPA: hypothetical protein VMW48_08090 [Vicinamibacterales bacterium]|nr:hypothetical protein [Vicinamibacterales bacterium]
MSDDQHPADPLPTLPFGALWPDLSASWGDMSADQADGFAPVAEQELSGLELNDDRGYGFGV